MLINQFPVCVVYILSILGMQFCPGTLSWLMQLLIGADVECYTNEYYGFQ